MIFRTGQILDHLTSVKLQTTRLTDGRTDRQTAFSSIDRVCIACSVVKITRIVLVHTGL